LMQYVMFVEIKPQRPIGPEQTPKQWLLVDKKNTKQDVRIVLKNKTDKLCQSNQN
jgi:hypothetical protein